MDNDFFAVHATNVAVVPLVGTRSKFAGFCPKCKALLMRSDKREDGRYTCPSCGACRADTRSGRRISRELYDPGFCAITQMGGNYDKLLESDYATKTHR